MRGAILALGLTALVLTPLAQAIAVDFELEAYSHSKLAGDLHVAGEGFHFGARNFGKASEAVAVLATDGVGSLRRYEYQQETIRGASPYDPIFKSLPRNVSYSEGEIHFDSFKISENSPLSAVAIFAENAVIRCNVLGIEATQESIRIRGDNESAGGTATFLDAEISGRRIDGTFLVLGDLTFYADFSGRTLLYWFNTTATVIQDGSEVSISSKVWDESGPQERGLVIRHIVWYELELGKVRGQVRSDQSDDLSRRLHLERAAIQGASSVAVDSVTSVENGYGHLVNASSKAIWLDGTFAIDLAPSQRRTSSHENGQYKIRIAGNLEQYSLAGRPAVVTETLPVITTSILLAFLGLLFISRDAVTRILGTAATGLYTKLKRDKLLDIEARDTLFKLIQQMPGINFLALHSQVKNLEGTAPIAFGALAYHLSQLERFQMIVSKREGRFRRYFDVGANMGADTARIALLQTRPVPEIARTVLENPGHTQGSLQASVGSKLGITRQALAYHLRRLEAKELIRRDEGGRYAKYLPTERLQKLSSYLTTPVPSDSTIVAAPEAT